MIRFLEANGYNVSYISRRRHERAAAAARATTSCSSPAGTTSTGRRRSAASMEAARDAGTNLAFFSGNTGFWKTRFGAEPAGTEHPGPHARLLQGHALHTRRRTRSTFTGTWRDPRFTTAANGPKPENALTGQSFLVNAGTTAITVPFAYRSCACGATPRPRRSTSGQSAEPRARARSATSGTSTPTTGSGPPGQIKLSSTTASGLEVFTDYGSTVKQNGTATHNMTMYKAPSGARVFNAGHRAVGLGPRRLRTTATRRRPQHAAGDRQPVRGPRRAARDAAVRPGRRGGVDRHDGADLHHHLAPASVADGAQVDDHRHRDRRRRRRGRRRRGVDRRRQPRGIRPRPARRAGRTRGSPTATRRRRSASARPTTAATPSRRRRRDRQRQLPLLDHGHGHHAAARARRRAGRHARSSWA